MNTSVFTASVALLAAFAPVAAQALTYTATRAVGAGSVDISITTDDTLGVLSNANILDWTITVSDGNATFVIAGPLSGNNSGVLIGGTAFTATANDLLFDYDAGGNQFALFQSPGPGSGQTFWCIETNGCAGFDGPLESILTTTNFSDTIRDPRRGLLVIASVGDAVIPEPASWALMIAGFGLVGFAARRRRVALAA